MITLLGSTEETGVFFEFTTALTKVVTGPADKECVGTRQTNNSRTAAAIELKEESKC
jgi:hypothetical protein